VSGTRAIGSHDTTRGAAHRHPSKEPVEMKETLQVQNACGIYSDWARKIGNLLEDFSSLYTSSSAEVREGYNTIMGRGLLRSCCTGSGGRQKGENLKYSKNVEAPRKH